MSYDYDLDYDDGSGYDYDSPAQYWHSPSRNTRNHNNDYEFEIDDGSDYSYASSYHTPPRNVRNYASNMYNTSNAAMARTEKYLADARAMRADPQTARSWYSRTPKAGPGVRSPDTDDSGFHSSYLSSSMESPQTFSRTAGSTPGRWHHRRPGHSPAYDYHMPSNRNMAHPLSPGYDYSTAYSDEFEHPDTAAFSIDETDSGYLSSMSYQQSKYNTARDPLSNTCSNSQFSMGTEESYSSVQTPHTEVYTTDMESMTSSSPQSVANTPQTDQDKRYYNDTTGSRSQLSPGFLMTSPVQQGIPRSPALHGDTSLIKDQDMSRLLVGYPIPSLSHLSPGTLIYHHNRQSDKPHAPGTLLSLDRIKGTWTVLLETGEIVTDVHPTSLLLQKDPNSTTFLVPSTPPPPTKLPSQQPVRPSDQSIVNSSRLGSSLNRTSILLQGLSPKKPESTNNRSSGLVIPSSDTASADMVDEVPENLSGTSNVSSRAQSPSSMALRETNKSPTQSRMLGSSNPGGLITAIEQETSAIEEDSVESVSSYEESLGDQQLVNNDMYLSAQSKGSEAGHTSHTHNNVDTAHMDTQVMVSTGRGKVSSRQHTPVTVSRTKPLHSPLSSPGMSCVRDVESSMSGFPATTTTDPSKRELQSRERRNGTDPLPRSPQRYHSPHTPTHASAVHPPCSCSHHLHGHPHVQYPPPYAYPPYPPPHMYPPPVYPPTVYSAPYDAGYWHPPQQYSRVRPPLLATFNPYSSKVAPPNVPTSIAATTASVSSTSGPLLQSTLSGLRSSQPSSPIQSPSPRTSAQSPHRGVQRHIGSSPHSSSSSSSSSYRSPPPSSRKGPSVAVQAKHSEAFHKMFGEPAPPRPHLHPRAAALLEQSRQSVVALDALFSEQLGQAHELLYETKRHLTALGLTNASHTKRYTAAIATA